MSKSADAFRTISEVADWLGVQAHVLRFWESKFTQIKPVKRAGGRRYYRPADMLLLGGIRKLLHKDGLSIKEVQSILRDQGVAHVSGMSHDLEADGPEEANAAAKPAAPVEIAPATPTALSPTAEDPAPAQIESAAPEEDATFAPETSAQEVPVENAVSPQEPIAPADEPAQPSESAAAAPDDGPAESAVEAEALAEPEAGLSDLPLLPDAPASVAATPQAQADPVVETPASEAEDTLTQPEPAEDEPQQMLMEWDTPQGSDPVVPQPPTADAVESAVPVSDPAEPPAAEATAEDIHIEDTPVEEVVSVAPTEVPVIETQEPVSEMAEPMEPADADATAHADDEISTEQQDALMGMAATAEHLETAQDLETAPAAPSDPISDEQVKTPDFAADSDHADILEETVAVGGVSDISEEIDGTSGESNSGILTLLARTAQLPQNVQGDVAECAAELRAFLAAR